MVTDFDSDFCHFGLLLLHLILLLVLLSLSGLSPKRIWLPKRINFWTLRLSLGIKKSINDIKNASQTYKAVLDTQTN